MTKRIARIDEFISAGNAASILTHKLGRSIHPDYIRKLKNVRRTRVHSTCWLYHVDDIKATSVRQNQPPSD